MKSLHLTNSPNILQGILLGLIIIASIFQDTAFQNSIFRVAGASPAFFLIAIFALTELNQRRKSTSDWKKFSAFTFCFFSYFFTINLYAGLHFGFFFFGENLIFKAFRSSILFGSLIFTFWLYFRYSVPRLRYWIYISWFLLLIGISINFFWPIEFVSSSFFHFGLNEYHDLNYGWDNRLRGFSYESSTLGLTIICVGLLAAASSNYLITRIAFLSSIIFLTWLCESKAALPLILSCLILSYIITYLKRNFWLWLAIFIPIIFLSSIYWGSDIYRLFIHPFVIDAHHSSSIPTRLILALSALIIMIEHPFGVGMTGHIPAIVESLNPTTNIVSSFIGTSLNLSEIHRLQTQQTSMDISNKSFLFDGIAYFGFPFLAVWIVGNYILLRRLTKNQDWILLTLFFCLFFALSTYSNGISLYIIFISYGIIFQASTLRT